MQRDKRIYIHEEDKAHSFKALKGNKNNYGIKKQRKGVRELRREGTWCCGG